MKLRQLKPKPLEREVQAGIVRLFRSCGGIVYSTSQGYRRDAGGTRTTPGMSDLVVFFPRVAKLLFFEVKRPGAKRTPTQLEFEKYCWGCGANVEYDFGGVEEAMRVMANWGLIWQHQATQTTVSR